MSATDIGQASKTEHKVLESAILEDLEDPLQPTTGEEANFHVDSNPFSFSPGQLSKLFNPKSLVAFKALGGLRGIATGLRTSTDAGLSLEDVKLHGRIAHDNDVLSMSPAKAPSGKISQTDLHVDRRRVFGTNRLPEKKAKNFFQVMWDAFQDKVLILLTVVAIISLALGLYQALGQPHPYGKPRVEWVEGVAIMVAVIVIVLVASLNDFQKQRQFSKLNKKKEDRMVKAVRSGKFLEVSIHDVLAGDVLHLEPGDVAPADGIFISGDNIKCDESLETGEPDPVKKIPGDQVLAGLFSQEKINPDTLDPLIISGSKILEGIGTFLVTGVGVHSSHGKFMLALKEETPTTPLQTKMLLLAHQIAKLGGTVALLLFAVLFIRFLAQLRGSTDSSSEKGQNFLQVLIISITVLVIAVPEGLPLAVTLTQAFAATKMLKDNNLVRILRACEVMGNATVVCSDKTGTLTMNKMTVVAGNVGLDFHFGANVPNTQEQPDDQTAFEDPDREMPAAQLNVLSEPVKKLLLQSIAVNSTAFESFDGGQRTFVGSKTESALLSFAERYLGLGSLGEERANADVVQIIPFNSARKCMGCVVKTQEGQYTLYVKGASEIVLEQCSFATEKVAEAYFSIEMTAAAKLTLAKTIDEYACKSLRTIGLAFRHFQTPSWPPAWMEVQEDDSTKALFNDLFAQLTFLGLVGIRDPLRPGVTNAVIQCHRAGVHVKMITGDNINTARAIAKECGIYTPSTGGIVMEGAEFRRLSPGQMYQILPQLQVLARSSPEDKRILVMRMQKMGETVAVTGDGTNDGPALKMADVGFSMVTGTEIAKEASAIILMDDNFSSIVKAIRWGRSVTDAVKKFLQFQLTINITAVALTFITVISSTDEVSILTAVQLLWVNLVQDTFAALALATDPPGPSVFDRKPERKSAPLITTNMWKMIVGQAIYQLAVTLLLNFAGNSMLGYERDQLTTLIFNVYVWMQIFNQYNNRRLDNKFNVFENIHRNWYFIGISALQIGGQLVIVFLGGSAFSTVHLSGAQWGISIVLGAASLVIGVLVRLVPDEFLERCVPDRLKLALERLFREREHHEDDDGP